VRVLYLIPDLEHGGAARQLSLLAAGLPQPRFEPCVCVLGRGGPLVEPLRGAGVRVEIIGWHRKFDPGAVQRLTRLVRELRPDVVHAWRPQALRVMALLPAFRGLRHCASAPFDLHHPHEQLGWLDWIVTRRASHVIALNPREVDWCQRLGIPEPRVTRVRPAAVPQEITKPSMLPLPPEARCIACVGPLESAKGFRDAIWAFDILRQIVDPIHLLLIGAGADRPRLATFIQDSQTVDVVHQLGPRDDVPALLSKAEVVWVPSRRSGGVNAALEAMAVGRPVVATRLPELAEIVTDAETGFLVPVGDKVALARRTRQLLDNAALRSEMGEAGRQRVHQQFSVAELVRRCVAVYER
jgi:glycosyltransferase involved in cell wall biosynthesis